MTAAVVRLHAAWSIALACLVPALTAAAAESLDSCAGYIDALPATIGTQGTWCLRGDLSTAMASGAAIAVAANNVTIDCNGFKLGGLAAGPGSQTTGIDALNRTNLSVRHCAIRGFHTGIALRGVGAGHLVEDNLLEGSLVYGIRIEGDGSSVVRRNRIHDTGGIPSPQAYGINASGDVLDNVVAGMSTTYAGSDPQLYAIVFGGHGTQARGNRVVGQRVANTTAEATGIRAVSQRQSITGNHVAVVPGGQGWALVGSGAGTTFCRDNNAAGYQFGGLVGCDDKGGNAVH